MHTLLSLSYLTFCSSLNSDNHGHFGQGAAVAAAAVVAAGGNGSGAGYHHPHQQQQQQSGSHTPSPTHYSHNRDVAHGSIESVGGGGPQSLSADGNGDYHSHSGSSTPIPVLQHSGDGKLQHQSAAQYSASQSMYESFYHVTAAGNTFRAGVGGSINSSAPDTATTITPAAAAAVVANQLIANGHHIHLANGHPSTVVQYAAPHHSVRSVWSGLSPTPFLFRCPTEYSTQPWCPPCSRWEQCHHQSRQCCSSCARRAPHRTWTARCPGRYVDSGGRWARLHIR